jgi:hypothetical protein
MTEPEFRTWVEFYKLHPFDDLHRHYRPAALIANSISPGRAIDELRDWLEPPPRGNFGEADMNTFNAFGVKPPKRT